jgi:hypothetical protein
MGIKRFLTKRASETYEKKHVVDEDIARIVRNAGFVVEYYEQGISFDNIVLSVRRNALVLRFVRDRGYVTCEARSEYMSKLEDWVDYNALARMVGIKAAYSNDEFGMAVQEILGKSNAHNISILMELAEDRDRYSSVSHSAISYQRDHSIFRE